LDLLNLIEVDEAISLEEAFKKEILSFMKKRKAYFNFRYQKKISLLDYIYNYINASNFNKGKKKTEKRYKKDKLNKNENYNNLKNKDNQNNESLSSNYSFILMNQGSKLDIQNKNNDNENKTNKLSDKNVIKELKSNSLDALKVFNKSIQQDAYIKSENIKKKSFNFYDRKKRNEDKNKLNNINKKIKDSNTNDSVQEMDIQNASKNGSKDIDSKDNESQKQIDNIFREDIRGTNEKKNELIILKDGSSLKNENFKDSIINYILEILYNISKDKKYKLFVGFTPKIVDLNNIFKKNGLNEISEIQFDFIICDLLIEDLISLFIQIFPSIHFNSSMDFSKVNKEFLDINDLEGLKKEYKGKRERLDLMGKISLNTFNENEKSEQMVKHRKLICNINKLIEMNSPDLPYVFDILKFNPATKKLVIFITNGKYEHFKSCMQRRFFFLEEQKQFYINNVLVIKNTNNLYQITFISKFIKKYKKRIKNEFYNELNLKKNNIFEKLYKSEKFKSIIIKLERIEKKIKNIRKDLLNYLKDKEDFIQLLEGFSLLLSSEIYYNFSSVFNININSLRINSDINNEIMINKFDNVFIYVFYNIDIIKPEKIFENNKEDKKKFLFYRLNGYNIDKINIKKFDNKDFNIVFGIFYEIFLLKYIGKINEIIKKLGFSYICPSYFYLTKKVDKNSSIIQYINLNINELEEINGFFGVLNNIETLKDKYTKELNEFNKYKNEYITINKCYEKLFTKTIYSENISYDNNLSDNFKLMLLKIEQDIQFLYYLKVDEEVKIIGDGLKESILNIMKDEKIEKSIELFLKDSNIVNEIQNILVEFKDIFEAKDDGKSQKKENTNKNQKTIRNIKYNEIDNSDIKKEDEFWEKKDLKRKKNLIENKEKEQREKPYESKQGEDKKFQMENSKEKEKEESLVDQNYQNEDNRKKDESKSWKKKEEKDESKNEIIFEEKDKEGKKEEEEIEEGPKGKNKDFNLTSEEIKSSIKEKLLNEILNIFYNYFKKKTWNEINYYSLLSLSKQIINNKINK